MMIHIVNLRIAAIVRQYTFNLFYQTKGFQYGIHLLTFKTEYKNEQFTEAWFTDARKY